MSLDLLAGLVIFAFVSSITPGPNNLMLMASGANHGFVRTLPHMLGVAVGFVLMLIFIGLGLSELFERYPEALLVLKILCVSYMVFLAWKIAHAAAPGSAEATGSPFSFMQAAAFQWVNPKAWAMALTAVSVYTESQAAHEVIVVALVFGAVNLPSVSSWALLGQGLRGWLRNPGHLQRFNLSMAVLLLASLFPVLYA